MSLDQLSERYAEHNRTERGRGFVFAGAEREQLFRRYVGGPGRRVLDLGCRDGALTEAYASGNDVVGVDADKEALAEAARRGIETHWADLDQPLQFDDASFDVVVSTLTLCTVDDQPRSVAELRRVLRPGGRLLFLEHVRSDDPDLARRQDRLNWLNRLVVHCDCNRATLDTLRIQGFAVADLRHTELPKSPSFVRPLVIGTASPVQTAVTRDSEGTATAEASIASRR